MNVNNLLYFYIAYDITNTYPLLRPIMIPQTIHTLISAATPSREDFYSPNGKPNANSMNGMHIATMLITFVILILLLSMIGFYLWNSVVAGAGKNDTGLITCARQADSVWQIIGLFILTSILFGGCCPTSN